MRNSRALAALAAVLGASASTAAVAATPAALDFTSFTDQVDVTTTMAAIMLVGGTLFLLHLAVLGIRKIRSVAK